jgi:uncharacterized membrane protein HdeD (DUF308 family)
VPDQGGTQTVGWVIFVIGAVIIAFGAFTTGTTWLRYGVIAIGGGLIGLSQYFRLRSDKVD